MSKELRVRGRPDASASIRPTDPAALSGAICGEVRRGEDPVVTAIGAHAEEIARQGLELAQSYLRPEGYAIAWHEESAVVDFGDGAPKRKQTRYVVTVTVSQSEATEGGRHGAGEDSAHR